MTASRITTFYRFLLLLSFVVASVTTYAQTSSQNNDPVYGYDPLLYNGRVYSFFTQPGTDGTQYMYDEFDNQGSITLRGVTFTNLSINYDIYNQQLILRYSDARGSIKYIEISKAWLESFTINGCNFNYFTKTDSSQRIYQVLGSGKERILYYHTKDLSIDNMGTAAGRFFTKAMKVSYVLSNKQLISYKNNGNFIKAFVPAKQDLIRTYIRRHSINVRKSNDIIMTELINYCNTLAGS
jgi:hypothetical protein